MWSEATNEIVLDFMIMILTFLLPGRLQRRLQKGIVHTNWLVHSINLVEQVLNHFKEFVYKKMH